MDLSAELARTTPDEVTEHSTPFKRTVAVLAAAVVLLGALVAFLREDATANEDRLAAEAQSLALDIVADNLAAYASWDGAQKRETEHSLLEARAFEALRRGEHDRAQGLARAAHELAAGTEYLSAPEYVADPHRPARFIADSFSESYRSFHARWAAAEMSTSWGARADALGATLALLAAVLFLFGLSLITKIGRTLFVGVALVLTLVGAVITIAVVRREVSTIPDRAIDALAKGDRLRQAGDYAGAISSYSEAIDLQRDLPVAYHLRAIARWQRAGSAHPLEPYFEYVEGEELRNALADARAAVANGATDPVSLNTLAALLIHDQAYEEAADLLVRILEVNDALAIVWSNLGAVRVAQGDEAGAAEAYARAVELGPQNTTWYSRLSLDATARSVLDEIATQRPASAKLATAMSILFTDAVVPAIVGSPLPASAGSGETDGLTAHQNGAWLTATLTNSFNEGAPASFIWYRRQRNGSFWVQPTTMISVQQLAGSGTDTSSVAMGLCPIPGTYRVDVIVGSSLVASTQHEVVSNAGSFTYQENILAGAAACRPDRWIDQSDESGLMMGAEERGATLRVFAEHVSDTDVEVGGDRIAARLAEVLEPTWRVEPGVRDVAVSGVSGQQETRVSPEGDVEYAFVGRDGALLRIVHARVPRSALPLLNEVLASVAFIGVDQQS
jgi:Tfp pilus assembly protein PilF